MPAYLSNENNDSSTCSFAECPGINFVGFRNMRPIKFKLWDKRRKQWILDFSINSDGTINIFDSKMPDFEASFEDFEKIQFTGLLDKNGKEIYEGDIVKHTFIDGEVHCELSIFDVSWMQDRSGWSLDNIPEEYEILGNIYENPELLKDQTP